MLKLSISQRRLKPKRPIRRLFSLSNNQRGQAVLEYTLILLVLVAILLGGVWQLNDAFGRWANNYFGEYFRCLMEVGELPSLGVGSQGVCDQFYEPFSLANGRPRSEGSSSSGGSGSSSASASQSSSSSAGSQSAPSTGVGGPSDSARPNTSSPSTSSASTGQASTPSDLGDEASRSRAGQSRYTGSTASSTPSDLTNFDFGGVGRPRFTPLVSGANFGEEQGDDPLRPRISQVESSSDSSLRQRSVLLTPPERKIAAADEDEAWGIGTWLRYLVIAAIIIAIVLLIGGQILQVSKSWE